jgi:hypothetical protein
MEKDVNQYREYGNESWQNSNELKNVIQEKEVQMHNMRFSYQKEIEELKLKLQQRDQTLKKVLEAKMSKSTNL